MQENSRANHKNLVGNDENKFLFEKSVRRYLLLQMKSSDLVMERCIINKSLLDV